MPAPQALASVLVVLTAAGWLLAELRQSVARREGATSEDRGSRLVLGGSIAAGLLLAGVFARRDPSAALPRAWADWLGLALLWCGIGLRLWSFHTLGRYFTFTVQTSRDQPVIATGPYRVLRHPSYTGLLLALCGLGVLLGSWLGLVVLVATSTCGLVYRIHVEERALVRSLGDDYRDFSSTRKRLVPFVW